MVVNMATTSKKRAVPKASRKTTSKRKGTGKGLPRNLREIYGVTVIIFSILLFLSFFLQAMGPVGR
jgi:hypothetical protein